jgi:cell division protease FtsH
MDGVESNDGVILSAATNRPDVLDPALLRPGRFDRQIVVDRPDVKGREGILRVHTRRIPLSDDVSLETLARGTPGLAGADLANMVNEAALLAARRNHKRVTMADFEDAKDKVMMGTERKSMIISEEEKLMTAYHESGHVLVAKYIAGSDPIHKVTIIPRGRALGVTHYLPLDERHSYSREYCLGVLGRLMGGRAADELIFGQKTTGAGNDIEQATNLARRMICDWGMSERLAPLTYGKHEELIFLGKEISQQRDYSENTAVLIDQEVAALVQDANEKARRILEEHSDDLHRLAKSLLEREILDGNEIDQLLRGETLAPAADRGNGNRPGQKQTEIPFPGGTAQGVVQAPVEREPEGAGTPDGGLENGGALESGAAGDDQADTTPKRASGGRG